MEPLWDNEVRYNLAYEHFISMTENKKAEKRWLSKFIMEKFYKSDSESILRILSIGCGTGETDVTIIEALGSIRNIQYIGVDPSLLQLKTFKQKVAEREEFRNIHFDFNEMTYEEFQNSKSQQKYDIILFCHVLYHLNPTEVLPHFINCLSDEGLSIVIHSPAGSVMKGRQNGKFELDSKGDLLLDFIMQISNYYKTADQAELEKCLNLIKDLSVTKNGDNILTYESDVFVIENLKH